MTTIWPQFEWSYFLISNGGDFYAGNTNEEFPWIKSELINTGDGSANILKLQKIDNEYYFFINDQLVKSLEKTGRSSLLLKIIRDDEQSWVTIKFKNNWKLKSILY